MKQALLVEDDPVVARLTRALLTRAGWESDWVETGRHAVETLSERRYEAVILDLGLPDLDGICVAVWLRDFEKARGHARSHIVVVSANDLEPSPRLDVDAVLQKPLRMTDLEVALQEVETTR